MSAEKITLIEARDVYTQDADCCQSGEIGQQLEVFTQDGGGGAFFDDMG